MRLLIVLKVCLAYLKDIEFEEHYLTIYCRELWEGSRAGVQGAKDVFGMDEVRFLSIMMY